MINIDCLVLFLTTFYDYNSLEDRINEFQLHHASIIKEFIKECQVIILEGNYDKLTLAIKEQCGGDMRPHKAELFIKFLYNRLTNTPTEMTPWILQRIH
ncbi:hypothetical protein FJ365_04500 [Candidatus Dependentiae bacterium]|nr:hypothetical protein [Candidatus Dependentiae bacterium]